MSFKINRSFGWLNQALNRSEGSGDTGLPSEVPPSIATTLDILGWDRWQQRVLSAVSTAANGLFEVFPAVDDNWPGALGVGGVTPNGVVRLMYQIHIEHDDLTDRRLWVVKRDAVTAADIKIAVDNTGESPRFYPTATTRMILLRPGEFPIGRVQTLGALDQLTLRYSWVDVSPGEYIPHLL